MYSVYALIDPRNEQMRYIGISKNVWRRYAIHLLIPSKSTPTKNAWIQELRELDLSPLLTILETHPTEEEARQRETKLIHHYLKIRTPLLNMVKTGRMRLPKDGWEGVITRAAAVLGEHWLQESEEEK